MLTVVGSYNQDLFFSTDKAPVAGETVLGEVRLAPGGKGFNQAIAAARMGASVTFIGARGDDAFGQGAQTLAENESIDARWQVCEESPTGSACILLETGGANRIVVAPGANSLLSRDHVQRCAEALSNATLVLAQGEVNPEAVELAYELAPDAIHMLNPAPVSVWMETLLPTIDILTPNETELATLLGARGIGLDPGRVADLGADQLGALCEQLGPKCVIVTLGARGCFLYEATANAEPVATYYPVPALANPTVDTTGAGDCLSGALAAGLVQGLGLNEALTQAILAASMSVTRYGAAPAMPRLRELSAATRIT